jgi:serine protease inhibitor
MQQYQRVAIGFILSLGLGIGLAGMTRSSQVIAQSFGQSNGLSKPVEIPRSLETVANRQTPSEVNMPNPSSNPSPTGSSTSAVDSRLTAANNRFGFKLFSQVNQLAQASQPNQNLLISPASVSLALAMLYNGAAGSTQQAMATTLEVQDLSLADLNRANAALASSLQSADPTIQLQIANSLWGRQDVTFKPDFLQRVQEFYQATITNLDFANPQAPAQINQWVSQNTAGKIPQIINQIDPQQILFLINAVYFKGNWTIPFDPANTSDQPFYLPDGSQTPQPMMSQQGSYLYSETDQFQAVSLPYGNRRLSMYIFLPKPQFSLGEFSSTLTAANWDSWISQFARRDGAIQLPKFTFEFEATLNEALQTMGMAELFQNADLSNLSDIPSQVNQVKHKTFIEVNEVGTEAAAVTSVGVRATSLDPNPPFQMIVNRPFFCAIRDNETGTILFMGTVSNPNY